MIDYRQQFNYEKQIKPVATFDVSMIPDTIRDYIKYLETKLRERDDLIKRMRPYFVHRGSCNKWRDSMHGRVLSERDCNCGLSDLLSAINKIEEGK